MGKNYVVNGATLKCVLGATPSTLTVLPINRVEINGKAKAVWIPAVISWTASLW